MHINACDEQSQNLVISRNQSAWFSCGTAIERYLQLPRLHASIDCGEIRMHMLQYNMMHRHYCAFFFEGGNNGKTRQKYKLERQGTSEKNLI